MTRIIRMFADESGNFDFSRNRGASRYFILTTVTFSDEPACRAELDALRYQLVAEGIDHPGYFHATSDKQHIRQRVYEILGRHEFRIDATILEKSKAQPQTRIPDESRFYQFAWFYHLNHVAERIVTAQDELYVVAASLGEKKKRVAFRRSFERVVRQVSPTAEPHAAFWDAATEPCLQIADYCGWAIQRKWETGDSRAFELIRNNVSTEFELWRRGETHYY